MRIETLADHRELVPVVSAWHVPDTSDPRFEFWKGRLEREAGRAGVPCVWVAFEGDTPIGSVSLVEDNLPTHPELSPWLAGLFVLPRHRRRGVGTALVRRCEAEVYEAGLRTLYLYTSTSESFYRRLGWRPIGGREEYESRRIILMMRRGDPGEVRVASVA